MDNFSDLFYAAWRPTLGWIGVVSFAIQFLVAPCIEIALALDGKQVQLPRLDITPMVTLTISLLGISGLRTIEKFSDVQDKH